MMAWTQSLNFVQSMSMVYIICKLDYVNSVIFMNHQWCPVLPPPGQTPTVSPGLWVTDCHTKSKVDLKRHVIEKGGIGGPHI